MSTLREAAIGAMGALETARNGLAWYRDRYPESTDGSDDEAAGDIDAAIDALRAELAKPDARPAPAEPQPAAQQEPLTVDYSGCDICARETATIAGFRLMVDPSLPPDVLVFRQGEREVGRIINAGITATKGGR